MYEYYGINKCDQHSNYFSVYSIIIEAPVTTIVLVIILITGHFGSNFQHEVC